MTRLYTLFYFNYKLITKLILTTTTAMNCEDSIDIFNGLLRKFGMVTESKALVSNIKDEHINALYEIVSDTRKKCSKIFLEVQDIIDDDDSRNFTYIFVGLFHDEITWGRVFIAFALVVDVLDKINQYTDMYTNYYNAFIKVLKNQIHPFVMSNGFWVCFCGY